ncbi:MAG: ABC transporter permease [Pirellulaceae bacterium]
MKFLLRRAGWMLLTLWIVFTITFFLMRAVPGGPFTRERELPEAARRNLEARYQLDKPMYRQYLKALGSSARLDFGPSLTLEDYTVNEVIAEGFPVSISLGVISLILALGVGMTAGVVSATRRNSLYDFSFMALATLGIAVPNFVLASLCVMLFVFWFQLFPVAGWGSLKQLFQPAICLAAPFAAYIARLTRAGMLEVLNLDYIRTAYSKGLLTRTVIIRHALRGAVLPVVSYLGPATAGILTGSLVLERMFVVPGMGTHFIESATQRDYPLAMGMVLVYTFLLLVMNAIVDFSYAVIDPRVKPE